MSCYLDVNLIYNGINMIRHFIINYGTILALNKLTKFMLYANGSQ